MSVFDARRWAHGVARTDVTVKQAEGRRLAVRLGFDPGPAGADGGVDGWRDGDGVRAMFFSRLSRTPLSVKDAREFVAVLIKRQATVGVAVASPAGYARGFAAEVEDTLAACGRTVGLHLLYHHDVLAETPAYHTARGSMPPAAPRSDGP